MTVTLVRITKADGSTPRDTDAWMAVTPTRVIGTIGGGQLEFMAIDAARAGRRGVMDIPLGPEIGQCCGGRVALHLSEITMDEVEARQAADRAAQRQLLIFGAGHTGAALAKIASVLPVQVKLIDSRDTELADAGVPSDLQCLTPLPEAEVAKAKPGSAFVILTHDHALDFLIASEALRRADASYVGMIGSKTKRARFVSWCRDHAPDVDTARLICPMASQAPDDKRPEVIAAFTATEVLATLHADARAEQVPA